MTQTVLLGELVDISSSKRIFYNEYVSSGVPFYRSKEIIEKAAGKNDISTELFISEERFNEIEGKFGAPQEGDLLLTSVGTLGVPYLVQKGERFYFKDGNLTWFRNFKPELNPNYLLHWITSPDGKHELLNHTIGSTQKALTIQGLKKVKISLPDTQAQRKIADILGTIDEKIELNRKMNETLEQMGQALFRHYFIGSPDAEKWEKGNISKLADSIRDGAKPPFTESTRYVALEHLTPRTLALYDSTGAGNAASNKTKFKKHDVLFGKLRPYFHKVAVAPFDGVCSTDILAVRPKKEMYFSFVGFFMSQKSLIDYTTQASEGTRMPRTSWTNICNFTFAMPPDSLLLSFNEKVEPFIEQMLANAQEVQTLTTLRDTLLPRLISGKVKI